MNPHIAFMRRYGLLHCYVSAVLCRLFSFAVVFDILSLVLVLVRAAMEVETGSLSATQELTT